MLYLLYISILLFVNDLSENVDAKITVQCRDDNNSPVDWYVLYKVPKLSESSNPLIRKGLAYVYITSNSVNTGWKLSSKDITQKKSMPGNTLAPLYNDTEAENKQWILYNDDPPNRLPPGKYGHTKGVVVADRYQGFWLIHSVPNFPPAPRKGNDLHYKFVNDSVLIGEYNYPTSGYHNGQSFLCISCNATQFDTIGLQLMYNQIIVYKKNLPKELTNLYPIFTSAANGVRIKNAPYKNKASIKSLASLEFLTFAKSDKWQKDLYEDFVALQLGTDIFAETWLNGPGKLPSHCSGSKVFNVKSVFLSAANVNFKSSHDHSKWVAATDSSRNHTWICIGDINRASTQYHRGGGTVCVNYFNLWKSYRDSVNEFEACPR